VTTRPSTARRVQATYLGLTLLTTLSASLIWGINTLFLLDAGLSNLEAFAANAFFTAGMMLFEIPTGVVADLRGRRLSYVLGALTLAATTAVYVLLWWVGAPFWAWALASMAIGLGFTFFSGAVEAWLVDALTATGFAGDLTAVFGRGQAVTGAAMLGGSVLGGVIAQATNLGVPFLVRVGLLLVTVVVAVLFMHDLGFTPDRSARTLPAMRSLLDASVEHGLRNRPVRWLMLTSPFVGGVGVYAFYALQPYLLELYGDPEAYGFAGLAAAAVAGAQILGGVLAPRVRRLVPRPTTVLLVGTAMAAASLLVVGLVDHLVVVLVFMVLWALTGAAVLPVRQAYLNGMIPSKQRATVLSFDSLLSSSGGVVVQPVMGRVGDVSGYPLTFALSAGVQALALPFYWMARREQPGPEPLAPVEPVVEPSPEADASPTRG
jgi:MFS family permease